MKQYTVRIEVILDLVVEDREEAEARARDQANWIRRQYERTPILYSSVVKDVYTEVVSVESESF